MEMAQFSALLIAAKCRRVKALNQSSSEVRGQGEILFLRRSFQPFLPCTNALRSYYHIEYKDWASVTERIK